MASTTGKYTSFGILCPYCHSDEDTVTLTLNDLTECHCTECDMTFSPADARDRAAAEAARWEAVVRWIDLASLTGEG